MLVGLSGTGRLGAMRDAKDYAIEFAGYMAKSAERYMDAVNSFEAAQSEDPMSLKNATTAMTEAWNGLRSDLYEFRKRRDRVPAANLAKGRE